MRIFENHVQTIKYRVLKEVAKGKFHGTLEQDLPHIPERIISGPKAQSRCCIYKERAIINERIKLALGGFDKQSKKVQVIDIACDDCPVDRFIVTNACRGCLAHKCVQACRFGAISIIDQKSVIDYSKCKECGKCAEICPYNAIAEMNRPCIKACSVKAIIIHPETKKASIDYTKCIDCGACVYQCPFGAIMDQSQIMEVIELLQQSEKNGEFKVYGVIAPAISSQFTYAKIEQVVAGIKALGFHTVVEAALGADIIAQYEALQFESEMKHKKFLTTSCCPAFVKYIHLNFPNLSDNISQAVSPMIATARLIKHSDPTGKVVFIGPCIAKKQEAHLACFENDVDGVLTFEELQAFLDAKEIDISKCEEAIMDNASFYGRIFARSGGVTEAIKHVASAEGFGESVKPILCDGLDECKKALTLANMNRLEGNFIEGMACKGGCICGPASLSHGPKDKNEVDKYAALSKEKNVKSSIRVLDWKQLDLEC